MEDRAKRIFGNDISSRDYKRALHSKARYAAKFGDDSRISYPVRLQENPVLFPSLGVQDIRVADGAGDACFDLEKGLIVGNIRMGFGHYRISIAIASAAHALGYTPYWMDLNSFPETTCTKVIAAQNKLYSMGSRLSQKSKLFNRFFWEPMNYEGFRKLSYNASDQKNAELMAPVFRNIPKDIPVIGTHVWPAQAAIHAGMPYVVNAIPDNWPMALHLAEGSVHTVQTHQAYMGYRILNGMRGKEVLFPMPADRLVYTGHYVDHELTENIEADCEARLKRKTQKAPMRFLLTIGGAGAQKEIFAAILKHLLPAVNAGRAAVFVNIGDYRSVWDYLCGAVSGLREETVTHFDDWENTCAFSQSVLDDEAGGIHVFWHKDIFQAVYCSNLLMRSSDVLITKPSELAFYPIPKLFIQRIGGHERWGAIHSAEMGDGTLECEDIPHTKQMLDLFLEEEQLLSEMCTAILRNKALGVYDGAYQTVRIAMELKNHHGLEKG